MKSLLLCALLLSTAGHATALTFNNEPGRVVISAEDIRRAGVTRPAGIVLLVEDWRVTGNDGMSWRGSLGGLSHFDGQQWQVFIDGKPFAMNLFATSALNRLPISMSQIDYVEVFTLPRLHEGDFVDAGLIHFHMLEPEWGWGASGRLMAGNETGEPGPYAFTEFETPNVERIGPDFSFDVTASGEAGEAVGSYTSLRGYAIDPAITNRNNAMMDGEEPSLDIEGLSLRGALEAGRSRHDLFVSSSTFDDLYFLKPYGREVPAVAKSLHLGVSGAVPVGDEDRMRYRLVYARNQLDERRNSLNLDFDFDNSQVDGSLEYDLRGGAVQAAVGVGVRGTSIQSEYDIDHDASVVRAYGDLNFRTGDALAHDVSAMIASGSEVAVNAAWWLRWQTAGTVHAVVAYNERLPELDDRIWYWQERGYDFLTDNGVAVDRSAELTPARRFSLDVMWRGSRDGGTLEGCAFYRGLFDQQVETQLYQYTAVDKSFQGPVTVSHGQDGTVYGAKVAGEYTGFDGFKTRVSYTLQRLEGDADIARAWDAVAEHHFRAVAQYDVNRKFGLWLMLNYWSSTRWHDYADVEEQSGGQYRRGPR